MKKKQQRQRVVNGIARFIVNCIITKGESLHRPASDVSEILIGVVDNVSEHVEEVGDSERGNADDDEEAEDGEDDDEAEGEDNDDETDSQDANQSSAAVVRRSSRFAALEAIQVIHGRKRAREADGEWIRYDFAKYMDGKFYVLPVNGSTWLEVDEETITDTSLLSACRLNPNKKIRSTDPGGSCDWDLRPGSLDLSLLGMKIPQRFHTNFYCVRNAIVGVICGPDGFTNSKLVEEICFVFDIPKVSLQHMCGLAMKYLQIEFVRVRTEQIGSSVLAAKKLSAWVLEQSEGLYVALLLDGHEQGVHMVGIDCGRKLLWDLGSERYALRLCEQAFWRVCQPLGGYLGIRRMYHVKYDPALALSTIGCKKRNAAIERMRLNPELRMSMLKNRKEE